MSKTTAPAPFRALDPVIRKQSKTEPRVIDADAQHERRHAGIDRWRHLPAEGPREVRVEVIAGSLRLVPSDRQAARDLLNGRAAIGRTYDRRREAYVFPLDDMARHGALNLASFRLSCEIAGVNLIVDEAAQAAVARHVTRLERQLRPIPRTVWIDENRDRDDSSDITVIDFQRQRR